MTRRNGVAGERFGQPQWHARERAAITEHWLRRRARFHRAVRHRRARIGPLTATTSTRIVLADHAGRISTLREHSRRARCGAPHHADEFSQALLTEADETGADELLCELMVGAQFQGGGRRWCAWALAAPDYPPFCCANRRRVRRHRAVVRAGALRRVRESGEAVLAANVGVPATGRERGRCRFRQRRGAGGRSRARSVRTDEYLDVLVRDAAAGVRQRGSGWRLASLAVRQHQQAQSAWVDRRRAESAAAMERELDARGRSRCASCRATAVRWPRHRDGVLSRASRWARLRRRVMMADGRVLADGCRRLRKGLHGH